MTALKTNISTHHKTNSGGKHTTDVWLDKSPQKPGPKFPLPENPGPNGQIGIHDAICLFSLGCSFYIVLSKQYEFGTVRLAEGIIAAVTGVSIGKNTKILNFLARFWKKP